MIFHLLDLTTWNAFYLYKKYIKNGDSTYQFIKFRDDLIRQMRKLESNVKAVDIVSQESIYSSRRFKTDNRKNKIKT